MRRAKYSLTVRLRLVPLLLVLAPFASADRVLSLESARKLMDGTYRIEYLSQLGSGRTQFGYFAAGIGKSFEAEFRTEKFEGGDTKATADLIYNVVSPLAGFSPGIAFGVQDAAGTTKDGRQFFGCMTFRQDQDTPRGTLLMDTTLGILAGRKTTPYLAVSFPFSQEVRLLLEASGIRAQAGVEIKPIRNLGFRLVAREDDLLGSLSYTLKF